VIILVGLTIIVAVPMVACSIGLYRLFRRIEWL